MNANNLNNRIQRFLFETPSQVFLEYYVFIFYPFCLFYKIWRIDWEFYRSLESWLYHPVGFMKLLAMPFPNISVVVVLQITATIAAISAMLGYWYRISAFIFFICMLLFDAWPNMFGFINVEIHLVWIAGLLSIANLHRSERKKSWVYPMSSLAFRCIELVIVLAYFQAGVSKLIHGGIDWALEGTTLQIAMLRQGVALGLYLAQFPTLLKFASILTLIWELIFPLYYLVPKTRKYLLSVAILFHLSTWFTLGIDFSHLWNFTLSILILQPALIDPNKNMEAKALLLYDDLCVYCNWFVRLVLGNSGGHIAVAPYGSKIAMKYGVKVTAEEATSAMLIDKNGAKYYGAKATIMALKECSIFWTSLAIILESKFVYLLYSKIYILFAKYRRKLAISNEAQFCLAPPTYNPKFE